MAPGVDQSSRRAVELAAQQGTAEKAAQQVTVEKATGPEWNLDTGTKVTRNTRNRDLLLTSKRH